MIKLLKLESGVSLILEDMPNLKSFTMGICCRLGSAHDPKGKDGMAHFIEHMMFKGTERRRSDDINEEIDRVGGELNAFTSKEITLYYGTVISKYSDRLIDILSDIVLHSNFPLVEFEKERDIIKEEIKMYEDIPSDLVHELNLQYIFEGSILESTILGDNSTISSISRDEIFEHYQKYYNSENLFISIAGNFNESRVIDQLNKLWSSVNIGIKAIPVSGIKPKFSSKTVKSSSNQAHICINSEGASYIDKEDYYAFQVLSKILGAGMSSRLLKDLREERALAYSVYSYLSSYGDTGAFTTYIGTSLSNHNKIIDIVFNHYDNIANTLIPEDEVNKAKNQIISEIVFDVESSRREMMRNANNYFAYDQIFSLNEVEDKIISVNSESLNRLGKKKFNPFNYSFTLLGNV